MEQLPETIFESREELMLSPSSQEKPTFRTAHFLKPSMTSIDEPKTKLSSFSLPSLPPTFEPKNWPLSVKFHGWRNPERGWKSWVGKMASLHESTWKKVGIHEAILNSTYQIEKNTDLVLGVAERWCPVTKSFVFPWGEATITLEDMMIAGYSVLGSPVFHPLETVELKRIKEKLVQARLELVRSTRRKADQSLWMKKFMDSDSEIEHEAFLSLWLSRFVLPTSYNVICRSVFPIAIHLARGTRIALAPAVLASIYGDLSLLKQKIDFYTELDENGDDKSKLAVTILAPFQLVLVWVWERFVKLRPKPNLIKIGEPRLAQWNDLKCKSDNVRSVLDSSENSFDWRPYVRTLENWDIPKFYQEKEMWVLVELDLDEELSSFIRCLMVSELVGVGCIEEYLPHRVARQFGIDQDIPGFIARSGYTSKVAWRCYSRPIIGMKCYIPSRLFKTEVTTRYLEWWNRLVIYLPGANKVNLQQQKCPIFLSKEEKKEQKFDSCFKAKAESHEECNGDKARDPADEDDLTIADMLKARNQHAVFENAECGNDKNVSGKPQSHLSSVGNDEAHKTSLFATFMEGIIQNEVVQNEQDSDGKNASAQSCSPSSSIADNRDKVVHPVTLAEKAKHCETDESRQELSSISWSHSSSAANKGALEVLDPVMSVEKVKFSESTKGRQDDDNKNSSSQPVHLQSRSFSKSGNKRSKRLELPAISVEKFTLTEAKTGLKQEYPNGSSVSGPSHKMESISKNTEGNNAYSFESLVVKLEDRIRRLEKIFAERKAALVSHI